MPLKSRRVVFSVFTYGAILLVMVAFIEFVSAKQALTEKAVGNITPALQEEQSLSCKDEKCKVKEVILNTGYDQIAGAPYSPVQPEGYWELVDAPNPGLTLPTPAWVISAISAWQTLPNSNWISAYNNASWTLNNPAPDKPYSFQRCFCTCEGINVLNINLQLLVDNVADVYFDNALIGQQTNTTTVSFNNPLTISKTIAVQPGKHCLRIDVRNLSGVAMGVDVAGTVTSPDSTGVALFLSPACCSPVGKIIGQKVEDLNCNGKNENEPGLSGWTITATNTGSGASVTAITDANGFYYFNSLPPGTYIVSESNQVGWSQSMPGGGGTYSVTLAAGQVVVRDFANCKKREVKECAVVVGREAVCKTDGSGSYTYTFNVTNTSGQDTDQILLTPSGGLALSNQVFNIPLQNGQSTTITVDIGNVKPGEHCFFVTLMTKEGPCCTVKVCPVLPECCATATGRFECDSKGAYTGTFSIVNTSPNTIKNIYLYPPTGVVMSQTYFAVTLLPGQSFTTPVITIKGAAPGEFCFRISMHTEDMKACCVVKQCIRLPECRIHIGSARPTKFGLAYGYWRNR